MGKIAPTTKQPKRSERWLTFEALIRDCPDGAGLTFADITAHTGIEMDRSARQMLREVMRSLKREWVCDPGKGIELASVPTSLYIVQGKMRRSLHQINRTGEAHTNVEHFYGGLSGEEQRTAKMIGVAVGTWVAMGQQTHERMLKRETRADLVQQIKANMRRQEP